MPVFIEDDANEEIAVLSEWERRVTASQARMASWSPLQTATLSAWAERASYVEPDAMMSLARSGITPDSPTGREVARAAAQDYYGGGWRRGQEPNNAPRRPASRERWQRVAHLYAASGVPEAAARVRDSLDGGDDGGFFDVLESALDFTNFGGDDRMSVDGGAKVSAAVGTAMEFSRRVRDTGRATLPEPVRDVVDSGSDVLDPVARTAFMAANAAVQEGQASFRQAVDNVHDRGFAGGLNPLDPRNRRIRGESDAVIALEQLAAGERVDTGSGVFVDPESGVARERFRRELTHDLADGHVLTPGRWVVDSVLGMDPGDTGYSVISGTVDAGVAMGLDPTNWVGGQALRAGRAGRTITTTGRLADDAVENVGGISRGVVPDLDRNTVASWLTDERGGAPIVADMAADSDFYSLWLKTQGKIPADTLLRIADEADPDMVRRILFDEAALHAGPDFVYTTPRASFGGTWVRRAFSEMPTQRIRLDNADEVLRGLDAMLVNARVPDEQIAPLMREAAEARNMLDRANVIERGLLTVNRTLVNEFGLDESVARQLTGWIVDEHGVQRRLFFWRDVGDPDVGTAVVDGRASYLRSAHLDSEMAPEVMSIPNVREIRRLTGALRDLGPLLMDEAGKLRIGYRFIEGLSSNVWKRTVLLRVAWPVRQVLIDEQLRLAAMGMPSVYRHPIHLLAGILDSRMERALLEHGADPNGLLYAADELSNSLLNSIPYETARRRAVEEWHPILRDDDGFVEAWGRELGQLHASRVARRLAENRSVEATVQDLLDGDLADLAESVARRPGSGAIEGETALREWVQTIEDRLLIKTGGNDELIAAVRDGYLTGSTGQPLYFWHGNGPTDGFHGRLTEYLDAAPRTVKAETGVARSAVQRGAERTAERWDQATSRMFAWLGSKPSNYLSRSPAWRHNYFDTLAEKFGLLTPDAQQQALAVARRHRSARGFSVNVLGLRLGFGPDILARMEAAAARGVSGTVEWNAADQFARIRAMERTQDLLGDLTVKGHIADAARVISPFASAWREMVGSYLRILKHNPLVVYSGAKVVEGAVQGGFFHKDTNGQWVFNYLGAEKLMGAIPFGPGIPIPVTGRVQGLTMGFEVTPGFGPVAQIPYSWFAPDTPAWDGVRDIVMPYGVESDPRHILAPEWFERVGVWLANQDEDSGAGQVARFVGKFLGGDEASSQATFAASVMDVMTYLVSTGEYDLSTEAGVSNLAAEARERAAGMWLWRGLVQFAAPSAPRPNPIFQTGDGDMMLIAVAAQRLYELYEEDPVHAGQRFLEEFGELAFGILEPKSETNALYIPGDTEGYDWMRENAETVEEWQNVAGLFAPTGGGSAGIGAWMRAIEEGDREPADPEEWLFRAQDAMGSVLYARAREAALAVAQRNGRRTIPDEGRDALAEYRRQLMQRFPGYLRDGLRVSNIEQTLTQLRSALDGEALFRESEAGRTLTEYLRVRDHAVNLLRERDIAESLTAQAAEPVRLYLFEYGQRLLADNPDFVNLWDRVLTRELEDPDE